MDGGNYVIIIIIIIGATALFEPRPSLEASASCLYSLQHSFSFSPPTSWHPRSHRLPILVLAFPFVSFCPAHLRRLILLYVTISQVLNSFRRSSHFGQPGHCFFRFRNNSVFRSRLSSLASKPQQSWRTDWFAC